MNNVFIAQTASDYAMTFEEVERISKLYPNNFYEKLEEIVKEKISK